MDVHTSRGGMEATMFCRAPLLSQDRGVRVAVKPKIDRYSDWHDKDQEVQSHPVL